MGTKGVECNGKICLADEQYCSRFEERCANCSAPCDPNHSKYDDEICSSDCSAFMKLQLLKDEIQELQMKQSIILYLVILLLIITFVYFTWKCYKWLRHKRCLQQVLKKLRLKKDPVHPNSHLNGKDLGGTTIQNMCVINDIERAPSQIYSVTGAEGSVMTVTTPISTRHPAENTTPSPQPNAYSYDNQALAVTPISEKPGGPSVF